MTISMCSLGWSRPIDLFTTAPARIAAVTLEEVATAARVVLASSNRTIGWFDPIRSAKASAERPVS